MTGIKDIAQVVGCSISTVSRVINDRDGVDPRTRKKILEVIDRMDFTPNLTAQGLRVKKGRLIGVAIPTSTVGAFSVVVQYALEAASSHGFNVVLVNSHEDPDLEETLINSLLRREINGVMLTRVSDESKIVTKIVNRNIPIVVIDRAFAHEKVSNVVLDNYRAGCMAAEHLLCTRPQADRLHHGAAEDRPLPREAEGIPGHAGREGSHAPRDAHLRGELPLRLRDAGGAGAGRPGRPVHGALGHERPHGVRGHPRPAGAGSAGAR